MHPRSRVLVDKELEEHEWELNEVRRLNHVTHVRADSQHLFNLDTGEIVATVAPGYKWMFVHEHPHIVPADMTREAIVAFRGGG